MRQPRLRVFDITIDGLETRREQAWNRCLEEVQHDLAQETGKHVRVIEKYIGGAKRRTDETDRG